MNKRFELTINSNGQCDIVDWVESKEKNAICIYNDLGNYHFSSAKALCELLNDLHEERDYFERKKEYFLSKWSIAHTENIQLRQENQNLRELLEVSLDVSQVEIDEELRRKKE